jgi:hypothetical protein
MKKVFAFIRAMIWSPKRDFRRINEKAVMLQKQMQEISVMPNKVEAIVRLFQVISPLQDAGGFSDVITKLKKKNYGQIDQEISALESLQSHFRSAGRNIFGYNRTKPGEEVTAQSVYLGDVFGLFTKTAAYWLSKQAELQKDYRRDISKDPNNPVTTWYCINDYQASPFVKHHTEGIIKSIELIKKAA